MIWWCCGWCHTTAVQWFPLAIALNIFLLKNWCNATTNTFSEIACQPVQHLFRTSYYACHAGKFLSLHGLSLSIDLGRLQAFITTNYANWSIRLLNLLSLEHILYRIREQSNTTYYAVPGDHILKSHGACKFVAYTSCFRINNRP